MKKKTVALLLALVLVFGVAAGGTLAWLTAQTSAVKNTFTTAKVNIKLEETMTPDGVESSSPVTNWSAPIIPGATYSKNPVVSVEEGSEACWLFVKYENNDAAENGVLTFTSNLKAPEWTAGTGSNEGGNGVPVGVWFRKIPAETAKDGVQYQLIEGNQVKIDGEKVTKANMPNENVTLTYTAYACQLMNGKTEFTPAEAWAKVGN